MTISLEREGLWVRTQGQQRSRIYPETKNSFFSRVADAQIEFVTDSRRNVVQALIRQGGQQMEGKKMP